MMTKHGFFSVVAFRGEPENLLVRARRKEHLQRLKERFTAQLLGAEIEYMPDADYPFRLKVSRVYWANIMNSLVSTDIDYPNFKAAIPRSESVFLRFLHDVWALGRRMQERE